MKIGLLADIHEEAELLRRAIAAVRGRGAERIYFLGDLIGVINRDRIAWCVELLVEAGVTGVWGNHDLGLCEDVHPELAATFPPTVLDYFGRLKPRMEVGDVLLCHVPPVVDVHDPAAMYLYGAHDEVVADVERGFEVFPQRVMFGGHLHRWEVHDVAISAEGKARGLGRRAWDGREKLSLAPPGRYYVTLHAVCFGWAAVLDTTSWELEALPVGANAARGA